MFCPKCGTKQDGDNSRFCHSCGADLSEYLEPVSLVKEPVVLSGKSIGSREKRGIITIGIVIQAFALMCYGLLACLLHKRMEQYDIYSISQVGKPIHMMYVIIVYLGLLMIIYSVIMTVKHKKAITKHEVITPAVTMLMALFNSGANKVYTSTSGGSLSGFLGYGMNVANNGYDVIDEFFYNNLTVGRYAIVAIAGFIIAVIVIIKKGKRAIA